MQNLTPDVCADHARIVGGILRGMRRRGLPANVDADDLRQEGMIALATAARIDTPAHAAVIAKNAMVYHLRKKLLDNKRTEALDETIDDGRHGRSSDAMRRRRVWKDPFFHLSVGELAARHADWERQRKDWWV